MALVVLAPAGEKEVLGKPFDLAILKDDELLVGRRVDKERIALALEDVLHAHCHVDGMAGNVEIKAVGEQGIELNAYEPSLCHQCSVLFCDREEVRMGIAVSEDDCFATQGTDLRAADVEYVAVLGEIG